VRFVQRSMGAAREASSGGRAEGKPRRPRTQTALLWALALFVVGSLFVIVTDQIAQHCPAEWERKLGTLFEGEFNPSAEHAAQAAVAEAVLAKIREEVALRPLDYGLVVIDDDDPNAYAVPGGRIVLTSGLFDVVGSEEALAMVIGHELGHFQHRDQIKEMSRTILVLLAVAAVSGDARTADALWAASDLATLRFSRKQEMKADRFGLDCLVRAYGHAGGATEFFEQTGTGDGRFARGFAYFSTHPASADRIAALRHRILERGYAVEAVRPLPAATEDADVSTRP
jgi:metalloprotease